LIIKKSININNFIGFSIMTLPHQTNINKSYVYYTDKLSNNLLYLLKTNLIKFVKQQFINDNIKPDTKLVSFIPFF